jgi:hypothetical protein
MLKETTITELISIRTRLENLTFRGDESFKRLECLNRLAHLAINGSIDGVKGLLKETYGSPARFLERFILNDSYLKNMVKLTGETQESGFRNVQKRLLEDIKYFTDLATNFLSYPHSSPFAPSGSTKASQSFKQVYF